MRESEVHLVHLAGRSRRRRRDRTHRVGTSVLVLGALAVLASACITDGSWAATTPDAVGIPDTYRPQYTDVSCPTASFCMGVGGGSPSHQGSDLFTPVIQTWDGSAWTDISADFPLTSPDGTSILSVSCASATTCLATYRLWVPSDFFELVAAWDGSTWTNVPVANFESLATQVACAPDGICLVAADGAEVYEWDGDSLVKVDGVHAPELGALDCVSSDLCWGTSNYSSDAWLWDGRTWTSHPMPTPPGDPSGFPTFYGSSIDCATSWWCVAVGQISDGTTTTAAAALWNGSVWTYPSVPVGSPSVLTSVSCVNGAECVAVGATLQEQFPFYDEQITAVWNGTTWSDAPNPPGDGPLHLSVSCPMGSDLACMAVGGTLNDPGSELVAARYSWDHSL